MAALTTMPPIFIDPADLRQFGMVWAQNGERLTRTPPFSSGELGKLFDNAVGNALSIMLGSIPIVNPNSVSLIPSLADCVEVGPVRVVGGIRPQNFDVGYRPDGVRFVFDSKTLNDTESVGKNWQNMINDLATEATTVHSRFPYAVVAFMVICPAPCLSLASQKAMIETLERMARRNSVDSPLHLAETIAFVVWNPNDGTISTDVPSIRSTLRIEKFSEQVELMYVSRYKGLPPHAAE